MRLCPGHAKARFRFVGVYFWGGLYSWTSRFDYVKLQTVTNLNELVRCRELKAPAFDRGFFLSRGCQR